MLQEALCEARKCKPVLSAFCVGCVLVTHWPHPSSPGIILSKGYSRELAGNTHAEANALAKAHSLSYEDLTHLFGGPPPSINALLHNADVYTTMVIHALSFMVAAVVTDAVPVLFLGAMLRPDIRSSGLCRCFDPCESTKMLHWCRRARRLCKM